MTSQSTFTFRDALQHTCEFLQTAGISGVTIAQRLREDLARDRRIIPLGIVDHEPRYTARWMWNLERKLLRDVDTFKKRTGATLAKEDLEERIAKAPLSPDQAEAVRRLVTGPGAIRCLTGIAGAGKTEALKLVTDAFQSAGYQVLGTAISGVVKEELARRTGISTRTIASYLFHLDRPLVRQVYEAIQGHVRSLVAHLRGKRTAPQTRVTLPQNSVFLVDEAGMVDTATMARLLHHARRANATVILTGDTKQLAPIQAGAPFKRIAHTTPSAHLQVNRRQAPAPEDRRAAHLIREGKGAKALESYARRGRLVVAKDRSEAIKALVSSWRAEGGLDQPETCVIFTQTREEARVINRLCQRERQLFGRLGPRTMEHEGQLLCAGDRILFTAPIRTRGIENGYAARIVNLDPTRRVLMVQLDHAPSAQARARGARQLFPLATDDLPENAISLFYAATTHRLQGASTEKAFLLLGGRLTHRELAYVQATRGRQLTKLFVDELNAGEDLSQLANAVTRSRAKQLAHDIAERAGAQRPSQNHRPSLDR